MKQTTLEHFELFQTYMNSWLDKLGLKHYEKYYTHQTLKNNEAQIIIDPDGGMLMITFAKKLTKLEPDYINRIALHEALECLLNNLELMAGQRYGLMESEVRKEIHNIIRTLENVLIKETHENNEKGFRDI